MKKILFFKFIVLALLLCACSKEVNEPTLQGAKTDNPINRTADISLLIDETDAYQNVVDFVEMLRSEGWENEFNIDEIRDVQLVSGELTNQYIRDLNADISEEELPDNMLYIFNFQEGFVIAAADKRLSEKVYALSTTGHATSNDFRYRSEFETTGISYNEAGDPENVPAFIIDERNIPISMVNLVMYSVAASFRPEYYSEPYNHSYHWVDSSIESLQEATPCFHQKAPFNNYCVTINGVRCPAGCANIAMLTTMVYNNMPTSINGRVGNRASMMNYSSSPYYSNILAHWAHDIGVVSLSTYTPTATTTSRSMMEYTMRVFGYTNYQHNPYSTAGILNMLSQNKPVIVVGTNTQLTSAHAYIVEAAREQIRKKYRIVNGQEIYVADVAKRLIMNINIGWYRAESNSANTLNDTWVILPEYIFNEDRNDNVRDSVNIAQYHRQFIYSTY